MGSLIVTHPVAGVAHNQLLPASDFIETHYLLEEDMKLLLDNLSDDTNIKAIIISGTFDIGIRLSAKLRHTLVALENWPKAVISIISGKCSLLGLALVLSCDVRIAVTDALFSINNTNTSMAQESNFIRNLLKASNNTSWAQKVILGGQSFDAEEALNRGVVSNICNQPGRAFDMALNLGISISTKDVAEVENTKRALLLARDSNYVLQAAKARYTDEDALSDLQQTLGIKSRL
uniref:Enoyl-CoA hydratase/isomerase family protein n=1 Tax=Paecilomyces fulvus TaxID=89137 RepID=A0A172WCU3_9EURO|nr:enoyl-CoA hydratase/isomerase family protein [Paecilomyces fulvus]